jgi:dolichol-phosphate mannosyltransferase
VSSSEPLVLVVVPTYEERDGLPSIVDRALAATPDSVHLLVVDDGSPDGTGEVAEELAVYRPRLHVLLRDAKRGLGPAYLAGFAWAMERGYDAVVEMDADGSHAPEDLPRLLAALADHDVVIGSRWVRGGRVERWPLHRLLLSRAGNRYVRAALGIGVADATGGYRAIRTAALRRIDLADVASRGYAFQVDLLQRLLRSGALVAELPIVFVERLTGRSKMTTGIVVEALWRVTVWGVEARTARLRARHHLSDLGHGASHA